MGQQTGEVVNELSTRGGAADGAYLALYGQAIGQAEVNFGNCQSMQDGCIAMSIGYNHARGAWGT